MKIWKLVSTTATSGHIGSICRFEMKNAQIGVDYGMPNIAVINATHGVRSSPKNLKLVTVYYGDGMMRDLGLKVCTQTKTADGKTLAVLYGGKSVWRFELLGEL